MKKQSVIITGLVVVVGLIGLGLFVSQDSDSTDEPVAAQTTETETEPELITVSEDGAEIRYQGVVGQTALETLRNEIPVETETSDFGEFVTSINGVAADSSSEYWAFYVNGELASVGAGAYEAADGDMIEWKLESF